MAKIRDINNLRYTPAFALLFITSAIALNVACNAVMARTLLPKLYPSTQPLRVTNNDGTLSNGDQLRGWRKNTYFVVSGLAWMISCATFTTLLLCVWPERAVPAERGSD